MCTDAAPAYNKDKEHSLELHREGRAKMKIRSVAVLGAGAVGAYILYGLSQTKDVEFCVVADGARKERLERDGILIDDKKAVRIFRPAVRTPQEARGADLLVYCSGRCT